VDSLGALSSGDAAAVVVRPERVHVENGPPATAASGGDRNVIAGTVDQEIYLGSSRKLTVDCGELGSVIVRESAEHLSEAGEGDRVTLSWAPDAGIVLADDGAGATARPAVPQAAAA
jgi:putative spermidine/putrescine transport system ATP-binding protein